MVEGQDSLTITVSADDGYNQATGSHGVTVDLNPVAVSINPATGDDMINAAEKGTGITLEGLTQNVEAGQTVVIRIGGATLTATVEGDGSWHCDVPANVLSNLADGAADIQVSVTNTSGNTASSGRQVTVDTQPPAVSIDSLTDDNILNAAEATHTAGQILSGITSAEPGQTVTVRLNGKSYSADVADNGTWSLTVPTADLTALGQGAQSVTVTVQDRAGNSSTTSQDILVDTLAPTVIIDKFTADNVINQGEHQLAQVISGSSTGGIAGDSVTVTLYYGTGTDAQKETFTTVLDAAGRWSIGVAADKIQALAAGEAKITASITDKAGNTGESENIFTVSLAAPEIAINSGVASDDVINAIEKGQSLEVSGSSNQPGRQITLTLNGREYQTTADAQGDWSVTVSPADLAALGEAQYSISASVTDSAGNSASTSHNVVVDTAAPQVVITGLDGNDSVISLDEVNTGQILKGYVVNAEAGSIVTVTVGGISKDAIVNGAGEWNIELTKDELTALGDGELHFTAEVTNVHGNRGTGEYQAEIDATLPGIRIDTVAGDDVVNLIEQGAPVVISGTVSGANTGADVLVSVNGKEYSTTLHADGTWSVTVPATDVARWPNDALKIDASVDDHAGNTGSWQHTIDVDLDAVAISIENVTADNVINATEQGQPLVLKGTTLGVEAGQTVTILFGGHQYTTTVDENGGWHYTLSPSDMASLREGDATVQVSVSNQNGNQAHSAQDYGVDLSAPTIVVDAVTGDNVINAAEATAGFTLQGQSNAEPGQKGQVSWNGKSYEIEIQADGSWSVTVDATDAALMPQGAQQAIVTLADKAGNSTTTTQTLLVDTLAPVVTIDNVGGSDNTLNSTEHRQSQIISGSVTGASAGDIVTVTVGMGADAWSITTVLDAAGRWSVGMPADIVNALSEDKHTISVTVKDTAGNIGTGSHDFDVTLTAPDIAIDAVDNNGVINAQMRGEGITLTGTSNQYGVDITLTLNGKNYTATTDATTGEWRVDLSPADLALLGEAGYTLVASVTDAAGNTASTNQTILVDTASPVLIIDGLQNNDDVINIDELATGQKLTGTTLNVEAGKKVTIIIGGQDYDVQVGANGAWELELPQAMLEALGDGRLTATASVTNEHGNSTQSQYQFTIDIDKPGIRIDTVSGDDVINILEHQQDLLISGTAQGAEAGADVIVTVNGVQHTTTLHADGSWSVTVDAQEVAGWIGSEVVIGASVADVNGNQSIEIGHTVELDLSAAAITIDPITPDDVLNLTERGEPLSLGGAVAGIEDGQHVTVTFAGHRYDVEVVGGRWALEVAAVDMGSLKEGDASISVSTSNINGNSASAERQFAVDSTPPTISINTVEADNQVNALEAGAGFDISGTTNAEAGQKVIVKWLDDTYTADVNADGTWSVHIDAVQDVTTLAQGLQTVEVSVEDKAGNSTSQTHSVNIDTLVPELTLTPVTGDNKLNATELKQAQILSGTCLNAEPGAVVTVTFNNKSYTTVLDNNGNWQLGVPPAGDLIAGDYPLVVTVTDSAGNIDTLTSIVEVVLDLPLIAINQVAVDDVVNDAEKAAGITITGSSNQPGRDILVTLNGRDYTVQADTSGNWQVTVSPADLAALGEANYTITASVTDETGNHQNTSRPITVDTSSPQVTITPLAGDDVINLEESGQDQFISGTAKNAEVGSNVVVTLGGQTFETTVETGGVWTVKIPKDTFSAFGDGPLTATATVTNGRGNSGSAEYELSVDTGVPGLRIDTVAGDDVINILEAQRDVTISGTSTGVAKGHDVTVTITGMRDGVAETTTYTTQVNADGRWSVIVPESDVSRWQNGELSIVASAENVSGNAGSSFGHLAQVDLNAVAISIDPVTDDNVINAEERTDGITLTGSTSGIEAGQTVTITLAGHQYQVAVESDGSWRVDVPATDLASLRDGSASVQVSVSSVNGNQADAGRQYEVDVTAPALSVSAVAGDNVINLAEAEGGFVVSGFSDAEQGQTVQVEWNGQWISGTVAENGKWIITLPAAESTLPQGRFELNLKVSDLAGNETTITTDVNVDTLPPVITVDDIASDNILNASEHGQAQIISGTCSDAEAGAIITVSIGGKNYTTALNSEGKWSIGLPASAVSALSEGSNPLVVTVSDKAGNEGRLESAVTVNTALPDITINTVTSDDIINLDEKGQDLAITGTSNQPNQTITVTLNGVLYTTVANADGDWSVTVPPSALSGLGEASYTVTASVTDTLGNHNTASHDVQVDTTLPLLTIDTIAGDNVINDDEIKIDQTISGRVVNAEAGQKVYIDIGLSEPLEALVQANGTWSVNVSADALQGIGYGDLTVKAWVDNQNGNRGDASREILLDVSYPSIRVDTVAGDDVINAIELGNSLVLSGTSTGLDNLQGLKITINGVSYDAALDTNGNWQLLFSPQTMQTWPEGSLVIAVSGTNASGNMQNIAHTVEVDTQAVAVSVNTLFSDDRLNAAEQGAEQTLTGETRGVENGRDVIITLNGKQYTATVNNGAWSLTLSDTDLGALRDGQTTVQVSVSNAHGNTASAERQFVVDSESPMLTLNTVAGDNIINSAEASAGVTLSGTTNAEIGQTVTVSVGNQTLGTALVLAGGVWSLVVDASTLNALGQGSHDLTIAVTDKAGNSTSLEHGVLIDTLAPTITIDSLTADNVLNATEAGQAQVISGSSMGAAAGDKVVVTLGDHSYSTIVDGSGRWSVGVKASDLAALDDGEHAIEVAITDAAGNVGTESFPFAIDTAAPVLNIAEIAGNDLLSSDERGRDLTVSGTSDILTAGVQVTVRLNGKTYYGVTEANGNWSAIVPKEDLPALVDNHQYDVSVSATDAAGNTGSASRPLDIQVSLPRITIDAIADDDVVNNTEAQDGITLTGSTDVAVTNVTVAIGGKTYTAVLGADNKTWSLDLDPETIAGLGDGSLSVSVTATDANNNQGSAEREMTIDASLPGIRFDTIAGDDIINLAELNQSLWVSGTSEHIAKGTPFTLTLTSVDGVIFSSDNVLIGNDGRWMIEIPADKVVQLRDGSATLTASGENLSGNAISVSHDVDVVTAGPAIAIDALSSDNIVNASEAGTSMVLTGTSADTAASDPVVVYVGGQQLDTTIKGDGTWEVTVTNAMFAAIKDGSVAVEASVTNAQGNSASASGTFVLDTTPPTLSVNPLTADNVINASEAKAEQVLSGYTNAGEGQEVTVIVGGVTLKPLPIVNADGTWQVSVPASVFDGITSGSVSFAVSVSDVAGNVTTQNSVVDVDTVIPQVTVNPLTGDNIINATEKGQALVIDGGSTDSAPGDTVIVTVNNVEYHTVVDSNGEWRVGIPASEMAKLAEGDNNFTVVIADRAGNEQTVTHDFTVNTGKPQLDIDTLAEDGVLNATEKGQPLTISGTSDLPADTEVLVTLAGLSYTAKTDASGKWSVTVSAADLATLGEANYTVSASAVAGDGNNVTTTEPLLVDTKAPVVTVSIIAADDIINTTEAQGAVLIGGSVTGAVSGDLVVVTLSGLAAKTATVDAAGNWSISLMPAELATLGDGPLTADVAITNGHGNVGSGSRDFTLDTGVPGIRIDALTGDNVLNIAELALDVWVTGMTYGVEPGATVTVIIGGDSWQTTVNPDGSWAFSVPQTVASTWNNEITVAASVLDSAGNSAAINQDVQIDKTPVSVAMDVITADNVLNAAEKAGEVALSGTTSGIENGQVVTITVGNKQFTATVNNNTWSTTVPAGSLAALRDGEVTVQLSVSTVSGNKATNSHTFDVDTHAPVLAIDPVTADNILNSTELSQTLTLTGTSDAIGQTLSLTLNGKTHDAVVGSDGRWSLNVGAADLIGLNDGLNDIKLEIVDAANNRTETTHSVLVDTVAPTPTINTVAGDDKINITELGQALVISGGSTNGTTGDKVSVVLNGITYTTQLDVNGNWSVGVPAADMAVLESIGYEIHVTVTDSAGNSESLEHTINVDTGIPTLHFDTLSTDGVLNAIEQMQPLAVSGTSSLAEGTVVTVTLNGMNYLATVGAGGVWSVSVPADALAKLGEADYTLTASAAGSTGNSVTDTTSLLVDTRAPTITILPVSDDDIIGMTETNGVVTINGTVSGAAENDVVTVIIAGQSHTTNVKSDGTWTVALSEGELSALGSGPLTITASVTNGHGNIGSGQHGVTLDSTEPGIRIDSVTADNTLNLAERASNLVISGTTTDVATGSIVTVSVNGTAVGTAATRADGSWLLQLTPEQMENWNDTSITVTASVEKGSGNRAEINESVALDLRDTSVSINPVTADNVVNAAEKSGEIVLTGDTTNIDSGRTVTVTVNGKQFTGTVQDNAWSVTLDAGALNGLRDGDAVVQVSVSNASGNSTSNSLNFVIDTTAPTIFIDAVTADNVLNGTEASGEVAVSGTTTAEVGQTVTVNIGGVEQTALVTAGGIWTALFATDALSNLAQGLTTINVSVSDKAGNPASGNHTFLVDTQAPTVAVNDLTADNIINAAEKGQALVISGTTVDAKVGDTVEVEFNGNPYTTQVDASGTWRIGVTAEDMATLPNGSGELKVTITDSAGNSTSITKDYQVDLGVPTLTFEDIADDNVLNAIERGTDLVISGKSSGLADGAIVTVTLGGRDYTAQTDNSGNWSLSVAPSDLALLGDAGYTVSASASSANGNPVSGSTQLQVDTRLPVVHIDLVAGDDVINVSEAGQNLTISGSVSGAAVGDRVQVIVAGKTHNTTVEANGLWSVTVDSTDVAGFGDGPLTIDASVQNAHGNTGSDSRDIAVNTGTPGIRFDTVAGDDVINSIEQGHALAVTGTSSGLAENAIVTLTDGQGGSWTGSVNADGSWTVSVPQNVVAGWSAGTVQLNATAENTAGTPTAMDHQITVDAAPVAITINAFTADNVLNAIERGEALTVSGSTSNVESGQTVTVMLAGKAWTAQVQDDGSWQFTVPTGSLNALRDGTANASASVTNQHGNSASTEWAFSVDASAPTLTIAAVTADNVLNKAEVEGAVTLRGTTSAEAGQSVTVLINGQSYGGPVTVDSDGNWSLTLASDALAGLPQGSASVTVSVTDKAGNSSTATHQLTVDTVAPTVTIDMISGDDIINAAEQNQALVVTGSSVGGTTGDSVSVEVGGKQYTTQLDAQGRWSVGIPAADMQALGAGQQSVNVSITDSAGNTGTESRPVVVDNGQPWLSFEAIAVDNVLNAVEQGVNLTINGTSDGLAADTWVTVTLNSKEYRTQIDASGNWTLEVTPADLAQIGDGTYTVTANASSDAGNPASGSAQLVVDTRAPTVTINAITDDNVLNKDESALEVVVSGKVSGAAENDIVYVLLAGKTYEATVDASLNWQATIPAGELSAIGDGALTITASVTNGHGNLGTAQHDFMADYNEPGIRFDIVAGDDVINLSEHNQSLVVKGSSEDLPVGAKVTLVIGAKNYSGVVAADGSWSVGIDAADVKQWNEGKLEMTVSASSAAGNKVEISHEVTVDLAPVSVSVNDVTDDNVLNALEMKQDLTLSGTTTGVEAGQEVTVTFGGNVYTTTVGADGSWSQVIPTAALAALRDGSAQFTVEVTNKVGNPASTSHEYQVDTTPPHITLNPVTADNVINIAEAQAGVAVTGTTNAPVGTTVTLKLNGVEYSGSVLADGTWQVDLSPDALATLASGQYTCTVTIADAAGNPASVSQTVSVDTLAPGVSFDITAGDDIINLAEHGQALVVSGTTTGTVAGNTVTVTVGDYTVSTVVDANGKWSIGVPADKVSALNNGTVDISATVTDSAGNATTQGKVVTVNTSNILLTLDTPAVDGVLNASEQGKALTLTGSSSGLPEGSEVTITLNGKNYTATVTGDRWTTTIPTADLALLSDGQRYTISVSAQDSAGNIGQVGQSLLVDTTPPEIIISPVSGDGMLNATEHGLALVISGTTTAEVGRTLTLTVNGKSYTATVNADGSWQTTVPKADVALMGNGTIQVDAMVSDASGNLGSSSETFVVDTVAPVVTINVVAGDDLVNSPEQLVAQTVSGKAEGAAGQTITVELAGRIYTAKVAADETWEVTVPALDFVGLVDGKYTITATVKDAAGNTGSGTHEVTLSGEKPTIAINTVSQDDVINAAERGQSLTISGTTTAPQGQKVVVTLNNVTYETTVQAGGIWSVLVGAVALMALTDGNAYEIKASVTNTIGNSGESVHGISVDLTPPQMDISIDSLTSDSGLVGNDFITNVGNVVLNGKLGATLGLGDKAQISLDGGASWIDLVVNGTQWSYVDGRTLADGTHNYQVRVVDQAGNVGATDSQNVVLDRVAPDASQSIIIDRISSDTGIADNDFITHSTTYSLEGRLGAGLNAGEHLQIRINGGAWVELEVNGTDWIYANGTPLADGTYAYQLRVIDDAGNVGQTASKTVTVDTVRPDMANLVTITHISEDSGLSDSDFITNDKTLTIHGSLVSTLQPGEYVQISMDGGVTWVNTIAIGTSWYYNDTQVLDDGNHDYWVRVVDAAGNVGATDSATVTIDTVKPDDAKTITVDSISDDTGYSDSDFLTNDTSITLYGTLGAELSADERAQISLDGGKTWIDVVVNGTNWRYIDTRLLDDGENLYQLRVVDNAGNVGQTTQQIVTVDTNAPDGVTKVVGYIDNTGSDTGNFGANTVTDERLPVLRGTLLETLKTGEFVRVYDSNGDYLGRASVTGTEWTFALTEPLRDGQTYGYQAAVVDAAGNEGSLSDVMNFTVELPVTINTQDTLDTTPIISGTLNFNRYTDEYLEVTIAGTTYSSRTGDVVIEPNKNSWYVQLQDSNALAVGSYDVTAVLFNKDGQEISRDKTGSELTVSAAPVISFSSTAATTSDSGTAMTIGEDGTWRILSNSTIFTQNGTTSSTLGSFNSVSLSGTDRQQSSSFIDFDRDGLMDLLGSDTEYANGQQSFKYNSDGTYTTFQVGSYGVNGQTNDGNANTYSWWAGIVGIDFDGDGYVDVAYGDGTPNDSEARGGYDSQLVMNTNGTILGFDKTGAYVYSSTTQDGVASTNNNNAQPSRELSGVDLNNDGYVDLAYHGTGGSNTTSKGGSNSTDQRLVIVSNGVNDAGNMTLTNTQVVTNVFYGNTGTTTNRFTTMLWADLNGDGFMDLFISGLSGQGGTYGANSAVFYNDGQGNLTQAANGVGAGYSVQNLGDSINSMTSIAVDWNGDGKMDVIEIAGQAASSYAATDANNIVALWTNQGTSQTTGQVNWSLPTTLLQGANLVGKETTGGLAIDLDYDGDRDLVVFRAQGGATAYVENKSVIKDGTSMILRLTDANGINIFYGNTVLLIDEATGKVVSSQIINPQGGVNMNDSTALVYFYGLDASKSYSAVLLANGKHYGGVENFAFDDSGTLTTVANVNNTWAGLKAVEKNHAYVLTAENGDKAADSALAASDGSNTTGIMGTGYNDTLYATAGTHVYNGAGGSVVVSDENVWSSTGGMDIVDYKLAGDTALKIDLSNANAQETGFGKATFVNIEGVAGGGGNDVFTGSTGDNIFEGRGGNDTFNIGNGGQDTLLYKLLNGTDATGGNGNDVVKGFTLGTWEGTADSDRIDLSDLLQGSGYTANESAHYINGIAQMDDPNSELLSYLKVTTEGSNTLIQVDLSGQGGDYTTLVTLNGVQTDLATLLANHQLIVG